MPYADKSNIGRWKHTGGQDRRCRGNTWFIPYETIRSRKDQRHHPASYPPFLVEQCITLHGQGENTILLYPFLGIGSSAVAAMNLNIKTCIGFEIDEQYLEIARERIENADPELPFQDPTQPS